MDLERLNKKKLRAKRDGNMRLLAEATNELGDLYYQSGNLDDALEEYSEQIKACEIIGEKLSCAVAHRMIGEIQASSGEYESALKHQNLYLEGAKEVKNEVEEQRALATLGRTYFCLAESLPENSNERIEALANARKTFSRSILLCDKLKGIQREELMTMRARLLLNQGLVQEAQMEPYEGINLIKSSIEICSKHKLSEDSHRGHLALGALYERQGNTELALKHLDLAAKTDNISNKAIALLAKSELLLRMGEWSNARKVLVTLYPWKSLSATTREQLEKLLRIAVTLCRGEEKLKSNKEEFNDSKLYEDLGDAAAAAQCYSEALKYYEKMLLYAEKNESNDRISAALVSLAQTFKDAGRFEEAVPFARRELNLCLSSDARESCRSALFLADLLESAESRSEEEIIRLYDLAIKKSEISEDPSLEVTALKEYLHYLETQKLEGAQEMRSRLELLLEKIPEVDSEKEIPDSLDIGGDIRLDELSDLEEQLEAEKDRGKSSRPRPTRRGRRGFTVRKNEKGETQLHVACINGSVEEVKKLLEEGHPSNIGDNCGWTPLHEAANHGFAEIVRLLINAGANINDPGGPMCGGITPLHDSAACGHFSVIKLLIDKGADIYALTREGESALDSIEGWRNRVKELSEAEESEYQFMRNLLSSKGVPRRREEKKIEKSQSNQNRNRIDLEDEDEAGDFETKSISAGEDYKRTIAVLRNRGPQISSTKKSPSSQKDLAPLLDSEQVLMDEWLEDDLGIDVNRKKNNFSDPFSSAKRKSGGSGPVEERKNKRQRINSDDGVLEQINIFDEEEDSYDYSSAGSFDSTKKPEKIGKEKRRRQSSLLSSGFSKFSLSRTPSPILTLSSQKSESEDKITAEDVSLQVLIQEKLFKLRITVQEEQKIKADNIIQEIQRKFQEDTGCTPQFELLAPSGDAIVPQDTIDYLVPGEKQITFNCKLIKMDIPPISDRYRKICRTCNIEVEERTMKCLKTCENTSIFRLRGRETSDAEILPLLKTLEYQIRLQVLYLSGASFNDVGKTLSYCLGNLSSLQELHLSNCDIDTCCLSEINKFPSQIRVLDLSYNPLEREADKELHRLLSSLKNLQTLNLSSCELDNFIQETTSSSLTNLDISWNPLTQDGLRSLLQPHMLSLNASGSIGQDKPFELPSELLSHKKFSLATLESLVLSSCNLCDLDLRRILSQTANLNRLVVNGNPKLTKISAMEVLQQKPTLSYIDISGCSEITEPPDPEIDIDRPDICTLIISMDNDVQQSWLQLWRGEGIIQNLPHCVVVFRHH